MIDVHANGFARISRVALRNGRAETYAGNGTATLRNVTIAKNGTTYFAGAVEHGGPMTTTSVTVTANTAPAGQGAGIASGVGFFVGSGAAAA